MTSSEPHSTSNFRAASLSNVPSNLQLSDVVWLRFLAAVDVQGVNFQNAFKDVSARPEGSRIDAAGNDPFSRRKTESRNYWATRRKDAGIVLALG